MTPAGTLVLLNPEPTFEAIESAGERVTKRAEAHVLAGFFFVSGEIERVTSDETARRNPSRGYLRRGRSRRSSPLAGRTRHLSIMRAAPGRRHSTRCTCRAPAR
jgi:hypothetical protein